MIFDYFVRCFKSHFCLSEYMLFGVLLFTYAWYVFWIKRYMIFGGQLCKWIITTENCW